MQSTCVYYNILNSVPNKKYAGAEPQPKSKAGGEPEPKQKDGAEPQPKLMAEKHKGNNKNGIH